MRSLKVVVAGATLFCASAAFAQDARCRAMLNGAPDNVLGLDAVRGCRGADAACAYVNSATGYGVLTLMCPASDIHQVLGAERLRSLRLRDGALAGECRSGEWRRDAGLPGCYP
jgi:hypothetical protein